MKRLFIVLLSFIMVFGGFVGCSHQSSKSVVELGTESLATWEEGTPNPLDESIVNGKVATGSIQGEPIHAFFDNKSVTLGTEQYDVRAQYPKKKDTYLSMHLSPSFMHKLAIGVLPEWDSGYDIEFDLKDGRLYLIVETVQN